MNYKLIIAYDGSRYLGWQKQKNTDNTIAGKLEGVLQRLFDCEIDLIGSGRTDAGVHARGMVANFHVEKERLSGKRFVAKMLDAGINPNNHSVEDNLLLYINHYLPEDISVYELELADDRFHSRYLVKEKWYRYRILNSDISEVFDRKYVYQISDELDIGLMQSAAQNLIGEYDFAAFTTLKNSKKSTVRKITSIIISEHPVPGGREIILDFRGEGFLYNMVRIITGSLIEVGKGQRSIDELIDAMDSGIREKAGYLVPGKGLCLMEVKY